MGTHTRTPTDRVRRLSKGKAQHLPSCQPCGSKVGGADSRSHLSTTGTNTALCCQTLPGTEPVTSRRRSGGGRNRRFDELPPSAARRDGGEDHCRQSPSRSTPSQRAAQPGSFIFWINQGLKVSKQLGDAVVSHAAVLMVAVRINPLDCFEYHKKDLEQ